MVLEFEIVAVLPHSSLHAVFESCRRFGLNPIDVFLDVPIS
jgi:hypothetical protein